MAAVIQVDGIRLVHVQQAGLGLVQIEVVVESGSLRDPEGSEGLASLTAAMLLRGTASRSYRKIMGAVNDLGATMDAEAQKDAITRPPPRLLPWCIRATHRGYGSRPPRRRCHRCCA